MCVHNWTTFTTRFILIALKLPFLGRKNPWGGLFDPPPFSTFEGFLYFVLLVSISFISYYHFLVFVPTLAELRSLPCFAVRNSCAHGRKVVIFKRFHCSLTKLIQLS